MSENGRWWRSWLRWCRLAPLAALVLTSGPSAAPTVAADRQVDLELVLAADASGSVDPDEWQLQLDGMAAAFRDPLVLQAIQAGPRARIAVALLAWADASQQKDETAWFIVGTKEEAEAFARAVESFPRRVEGGTGIGSAIAASIRLIQYNDIISFRRVVDVSGDGIETPIREDASILLPTAIAMADATGVTVNGLAIANEVHNLDEYYRRHVATGPGHFVTKAKNYVDFRRAIREKLVREITPNLARRDLPVVLPAVRLAGSPAVHTAGQVPIAGAAPWLARPWLE